MKEINKENIPANVEEMLDYHLADHSTALEMIHTLADYLGVYLQPVIGKETGSVHYKVMKK